MLLGRLLAGDGEHEEAITLYERAVSLGGFNTAQGHLDLWKLYAIVADHESALRHAERAMDLDLKLTQPMAERAYQVVGNHKTEAEKQMAIRVLELAAARTDRRNAWILAHLGRVYAAEGRIDEADQAFADALQLPQIIDNQERFDRITRDRAALSADQ